ncbi:MAG: ABC transporter permease [Acidimicrobiales bacterium]
MPDLANPRAPRSLVAGAALIAGVLVLPLAFLLLQASDVGWSALSHLLFRHLTAVLLLNTIELAVLVTLGCAVIGTAAAWCVERTDLPGRRIWAVLLVIPVAIPDFVVGYAWSSAFPSLHGLVGAAIVMTLATYPLVYLPVAAALRRTDPALEETSLSLGVGRVATFRRVTLRQIRGALLGGSLLVALALLAEYGAFEIMRFKTFTTAIFVELNLGFNSAGASALSLVLVALCLIVLAGEAASTRGPATTSHSGRPATRRHAHPLVLVGFAALAIAALGVPIGTIGYWMTHGRSSTLPGASVLGAASHTVLYSAAAAALATVLALPVAILAVRHRSAKAIVIERSTYIVQALPGLVIALSLVFFAIRYARHFYQTSELLIAAYAVLFFPLALICVRASVAQAPRRLEEMGRSLGRTSWYVLARVTVPLVGPGLAAAFCLVFLSAVTELTATLVLVPTGVHTLATQFWKYQVNASYGAAAPYAAILVGVAVAPSYLLSRWFDRRVA